MASKPFTDKDARPVDWWLVDWMMDQITNPSPELLKEMEAYELANGPENFDNKTNPRI